MMYDGASKVLGCVVWPCEVDGQPGHWWIPSLGYRFWHSEGDVWIGDPSAELQEPQLQLCVPQMTLREAVAYSIGVRDGKDVLAKATANW